MLAGIGGLAAGALLVGKASSGPLDPPSGPIAPTPGPEPRIAINQTNTPGDAGNTFRITQPGSYYFPGNLFGEPQKSGILIASSDVTIEMMGFRLQPINVGSGSGIVNSGNRVNITIRNGVVTKWEGSGIDLSAGGVGGQCSNVRIEGVTVTENLARGIRAGQNAIVQNCIAQANGGTGIDTGVSSAIQNCTVRNSALNGIVAGLSCVVSQCISRENGGIGIFVNSGSTVIACTATSNTGNGINSSTGCTVTQCTARQNTGSGITASSGTTIDACTADQNSANGISVTDECVIQDCTARTNGASGIVGVIGNRIIGCAAANNTQNGIAAGSKCMVVESSVSGSTTGAGISMTGTDSRVEDNNSTGNRIGIECIGSGNFIARNTCSGNTTQNWDIASNNKCLVINGTSALRITGDSGGTSPGSTDPNANYTY